MKTLWHVDTLQKSVVVNSESFETEQAAWDKRHAKVASQNQDNLAARRQYHEDLRDCVTDDESATDTIPRLYLWTYDFSVASCTEPLCVSCYEAGLRDIPNAV